MDNGSEAHRTLWRVRAVCAVVVAGLVIGCAVSTEPSATSRPPGTNDPPATPPPRPPAVFPELSRPGVIYAETGDIYGYSAVFHHSLIASRYVFYPDNSFELQFVSGRFGFFAYTGRLRREDARVTFDWDGWSTAGPWGAIGTLRGDSLRVEYNLIMQLTDFVDGVYVRSGGSR